MLGSRFLDGHSGTVPFFRRLLLRCATRFTRFQTGLPVTDSHNGLRGFERRAAEQLNLTMDRMAHASEILDKISRYKMSYVELPVSIDYTQYSQQKGQRAIQAFTILAEYFFGGVK